MALVALYRPGPLNNGLHTLYAERKHGRESRSVPAPVPRARAGQTRTGSWSIRSRSCRRPSSWRGSPWAKRTRCARSWGRRSARRSAAQREKFIAGSVAQGHPERIGREIFDLIEPFADYGFNASHACAYGLVAYQTAYLMAHHPVEYMAAILTSVKDDKDRKPYYLYACRSMRHRRPPARRERVRRRLRTGPRRATGDPLRPLRGPQRGGGRGALRRGSPRPGGCVRELPGVLPSRGALGLDEAGARVPDLRGRVRLAWATRAADCSSRTGSNQLGRRCRGSDPRRATGRGRRPVLALRSGRRAASPRSTIAVAGGAGARQAAAALQGEGDARSVRDRSPVARGRRRSLRSPLHP